MPVLDAIESTWSASRGQHNDVQPATPLLDIGPFDRGHLVMISASRWEIHSRGTNLPELMVAVGALELRLSAPPRRRRRSSSVQQWNLVRLQLQTTPAHAHGPRAFTSEAQSHAGSADDRSSNTQSR